MTKQRFLTCAKRLIVLLLVLLLLAALSLFSINVYMKHSVEHRILSLEEASALTEVDCILILGCGVQGDRPSPMLQDRLDTGLALYAQSASAKLLMSGDHGQPDYDEVNVMKHYAIQAGIPSEDVFMDHAGFSTYESMVRARDIFCAKKILVVTQDYHLYRALYVANALGLDAYGVAAAPTSYSGQAYRDFRELFARAKDFCYTLLTPPPRCLGDSIPVSGNGDLSNG